MNYLETLNWMFNKLPMYQTQGASAYKKDLTNTLALSLYLGNPEKNIKCIHVAGTNGKGSTSHMLASILQEAGYKVGLYTSPHLIDFKERIKINGEEISETFITSFIEKHKPFFETKELSFFEMTVGLAFEYFNIEKVDFAVIEVGMGGRLDSTNIITPLISVITNIGLDHTQFLGTTLESIASEKAGIIKPEIPVVIGEYTKETKLIFCEKALENNATIFFASDSDFEIPPSDLKGNYQEQNKKTVIQTIQVLIASNKLKIAEEQVKLGILNVAKNTGIQGRWQQINVAPKVICDTAHNKHGLEIVINQIKNEFYENLHFVIGFVNDKNMDDILPLFPKNAKYYFCCPKNPRGLNNQILSEKAKEIGMIGEVFNSVSEAYTAALKSATSNDFIYIGGSTFVVAEIL